MGPDRGSRRRVLIGILVAVLLIALFGLAIYLIEKHGLLDEQFGDSGDWGKNGAEQFSLELNDREYVSSDDIDAYLVIGKDDPKEGEQGYNGEMADFMSGMFNSKPIDITDRVKAGERAAVAFKVYPIDITGSAKPKSWGAAGEWHNGGDGWIGQNVTQLMTVG